MNHYAGTPWTDRAAARMGHYASQMLIGAIVAVIVIGLFPPPGALAFTVPIALFAFVILSWLLMRQHDRTLCESCVLSMPLDAAGRAAKLRRRFWMTHTGSEPRFLIPYLAVLIGSNFATTDAGRIGWAVVQSSMIYLLMAQSTHRKLQPWCPWCSGGGGGGEEVDDTPPVLPNDDRQIA